MKRIGLIIVLVVLLGSALVQAAPSHRAITVFDQIETERATMRAQVEACQVPVVPQWVKVPFGLKVVIDEWGNGLFVVARWNGSQMIVSGINPDC